MGTQDGTENETMTRTCQYPGLILTHIQMGQRACPTWVDELLSSHFEMGIRLGKTKTC